MRLRGYAPAPAGSRPGHIPRGGPWPGLSVSAPAPGTRGHGRILNFHARGKGGGSGPVDNLLGRERNREGATVRRGNPEEVRELIDSTPFSKKYTSGVLSFAEKEIPPGERERVMPTFERVLMPGLEKDQYSILCF